MIDFDDDILDNLASIFGEDQIKEVVEGNLTRYQNDPVGFMKNVLKIEHISDDLISACESVLKNKITIAQSANATGKTWLLGHLAIWFYLCFEESQVIMIASPPESNLKEKSFAEVLKVFYKNKHLFDGKHVVTTLKIAESGKGTDANPKHFIIGKAIPSSGSPEERTAKFSGSHSPQMLVLVDEANGCPDEIFVALEGVLSGSWNKMFCTLNPRQKSGACYQMTKTDKANTLVLSAFSHPNVVTGEDIVPGAVSREKTVQRITEWTQPLPDGEEPTRDCFEVPEYLVGCSAISGSGKQLETLAAGWRRITYPPFSTIVLGQYPSTDANTLIDETWIDAAVSRWKLYTAQYGKDSTKGINCVLGCDIADQGMDFCCVAKRYGSYISGFERWRGLDLDISSDKISQIYISANAYQCNVEADGIGAAIPPKVSRQGFWKCENKECEGYDTNYIDDNVFKCPICQKEMSRKHINVRKVYVSSPSNKKCDLGKFGLVRDELYWLVADWLKRDPSAMIPDIPELREEMLAFEYFEDQSSGKIKVSDKKSVVKKIQRSPDYFASLIQCFFEPKIPSIRVI
ncbi:MAG: hypothetical protein WC055_00250 [Melioribacteraceae bacterium]